MHDADAIALLTPEGGAIEAVREHDRSAETWADLGCGSGTFTRALAAHLAPGSTIHAMDTDVHALSRLPAESHGVRIQTHAGDFTRTPWPFTSLDGILMANSLHYVREQFAFVARCADALPAHGVVTIVEYDTDTANPWVPYPLSLARLTSLFHAAGYRHVQLLGTRPSRYGRAQLYAVRITSRR